MVGFPELPGLTICHKHSGNKIQLTPSSQQHWEHAGTLWEGHADQRDKKPRKNRELQKVLKQRREQVSRVQSGAFHQLEGSGTKRTTDKSSAKWPSCLVLPLGADVWCKKVMRASTNCRTCLLYYSSDGHSSNIYYDYYFLWFRPPQLLSLSAYKECWFSSVKESNGVRECDSLMSHSGSGLEVHRASCTHIPARGSLLPACSARGAGEGETTCEWGRWPARLPPEGELESRPMSLLFGKIFVITWVNKPRIKQNSQSA